MSELQRLSDAATPGEFRYSDIGGAEVIVGGATIAHVYGINSDAEAVATARLFAYVVNAVREGRLVEAPLDLLNSLETYGAPASVTDPNDAVAWAARVVRKALTGSEDRTDHPGPKQVRPHA